MRNTSLPSAVPELERRFAAVIFDFDGVIVESTTLKTEAFRILFAHRGDRLERILDLHRRHAGVDRMTKFEMIYRDILHEPLDTPTRRDLATRFAQIVEDAVATCPMVPGATDLLTALEGHVPAAVVSATPQAELERIVARRGLGHFFKVLCGSPPGKADAVRRLLLDEDWDAAEVLMIGDASADLAAARSNGIAFIGRLTPDDPHEFPPDVPSFHSLIPLAEAAMRLYPVRHAQAALR
jgi:phosphoglycolate phosphatase